MGERVSPVEDLPVRVHPGVSNPDLVPLKQLLVWELVGRMVVIQVGHTGAGNHLHGTPAGPHLGYRKALSNSVLDNLIHAHDKSYHPLHVDDQTAPFCILIFAKHDTNQVTF